MLLSSLLPLLALVCVVAASTIAPKDENIFVDAIKNRFNQEFSIVHYNGIKEKKATGDVVSAVISLGPINRPQEKIYDCTFEISKSTTDHPTSVESFTCEAFEVPYVAAAAPYAGGWSPINIGDDSVQGLLVHVNKALTQRNPPLQIVRINNAESQVVAGLNYRLIVQAGPKGSNSHVTDICNIVVLVQHWINLTQVTNVECNPLLPVPYVGGWQNVDVSDARVLNAANFAIKKLNSQCNCLFRKSFTNIVSASKQIVNGEKYKIVWNIGESTCRNNDENMDKDLTQCPLKSTDNVSTCHVTVWLHARNIEPFYNLVEHNC